MSVRRFRVVVTAADCNGTPMLFEEPSGGSPERDEARTSLR